MNAARPFDPALGAIILDRIADGESLRTICDGPDMPSRPTFFKWLAANAEYANQYAHAREAQADAIFDEILNIADDARNDWMETLDDEGEKRGWRENGEAMQRAKLRVDARKWMAGKLRPKKYGEKLELSGDADNPLRVVATIERRIVDAKKPE